MREPFSSKLRRWLRRPARAIDTTPPEIVAARQLIAAIDRGGIPLNTVRINQIARALGLEVSRKAAPEETIERIRQALLRST